MGPSTTSSFALLLLTAFLPKFVVPDFPDLTIETRRTMADWHSSVDTLFLKGARQRNESVTERPSPGKSIDITQCDVRRRYILADNWKTYASFPIEEWSERMRHARPLPQPELTGAEVNVTIDSVDTGERRKLGSLEARHVKTTTRVEPGPGAVTPASVTEVDGWYIDLRGFGCQDSRNVGIAWGALWSGKQDRMVIRRLGKSPRGYAVEETSRKIEGSRTTISKVELLDFSEAPLDASLFELPAGYRPALRTPHGGHDMTKPDTFANRLQVYWDYWTASARRWFR
ncbi:MAG TPA: hypothetical protein VEJ47_11300 [Candidatus Eremiobacteraceae bacterium]|nr:hypothetical protein [Candidatus Eremiobacteraceae bacterium]HXZ41885.1 hypothetical protein [Terriglobales bacterium]